MGEYTGLIMFLWIVGAPTIGLALLPLRDTRTSRYETSYVAPRRDAERSMAP